MAIAFADDDFLRASRLFRYIVDDSFGGQIVSAVLDHLRVPQIGIAESDPASRLRSLREVMNTRSELVLAVDGRGPYFDVGTGVVTLAKTLAATLVPCSAVATKTIRIPNRRVPITVPRPFSIVSVQFGEPIDPPATVSSGVLTARHLRDALNRLQSGSQRRSSNVGTE